MEHAACVHRVCPLCRHDNANGQKLYPDITWGLTDCAECGFVYLETVPDYEDLTETIGWEQSWRDEKTRRQAQEPVLHSLQVGSQVVRRMAKRDKLTRLIRKFIGRGRMLDVGCGVGHRAHRWPEAIVPYGIDIEAEAVAVADKLFRARGGYAICASAVAGLAKFEDDFFDGALMRAYLEHESSPLEVLGALRRKRKDESAVIIKVPNYGCLNRRVRGRKWCGYRFPDHVNYFTPESLTRLLDIAGYSVMRFNVLDRFPTSDNMWLVARARAPDRKRTPAGSSHSPRDGEPQRP